MRVVTREIIIGHDLLQITKTCMAAHVDFWGDALPADITQRSGEVVAGTLEGIPIIVCFDGIAHILHPGLMKFQRSLQGKGFMEDSNGLAIEKVVKDVSKGGLQIHSHGYTQG